MTLLYLDGFDHYNDTSDRHLAKWDTESTSTGFNTNAGTGQAGSRSGRFTSAVQLYKNISSRHTVIAGFWFSLAGTSAQTSEILGFYNIASNGTATFLAGLHYDNGQILARGVLGAAADKIYIPGIQLQSNAGGYYIELKAFMDTYGSLEVHVDGETVATRSGINTGQLICNQVRLGMNVSLGTMDLDDFYVLDTLGSTFNNFLGPIIIETLTPNANGTTNDWSVLTGPSNYQDVDEIPPDDDTSYVHTNVLNEVELYNMTSLSTATGTVSGVQVVVYAKKDSASSRVLRFAARSGTTTSSDYGSASLTENYKFRSTLIETNPDTSSAWTISEINSAEFGFKLQS